MHSKIRIIAICLAFAMTGEVLAVTVPLNRNKLSNSTYRRLEAAQSLMASGKYTEALSNLTALIPQVKNNRYEYAVTEQNIAYVYINRGDYKAALSPMLGAIQQHSMTQDEQLQAVLDLAKLYARTGQYNNAKLTMGSYLKAASGLSPDAGMLMAEIEAKLGQCSAALPYVKRALPRKSSAPESWYQLWISCAYSTRQYGNAVDGLHAALERWPNKADYWRQLGQIYAQQGDNDKALGVFALMYRQGLAENEQDYLNLVSLYIQNNEPYEAANVLQKGLTGGIVAANEANYDLLAATWLDAKDYDKAISSLGLAAKYAKTGDTYLKQAQLYQQSHEWFSVVKATQRALQKGNLNRPGRAWLLQGVAQAENKQYPEAANALKQATKYGDVRGQAETWLRYITARTGQSY